MSQLLEGLNPAQAEAVRHTEGPLLIMAGAGSGKTRVLTCRIAYLLEQGVAPSYILAITFTNKAALEMKERVNKMVGDMSRQLWLSTFHAFCARFLRLEIESLGMYNRNFVIYDAGDTLAMIKECLKELNLDDKQYIPRSMQGLISNAKNALQDAGEYARNADNFRAKQEAELYELYQKKLVQNNALDFDDLLLLAVRILETKPEVLQRYQTRFSHILIDEYQDTNRAQYLLAKHLAAHHRNLCVVGDADQSIYGWRGADIRNILDFERDYPETKVIKLEQNYRSTEVILEAANAVIANNSNRKPKDLWTDIAGGEPITCYEAVDERDEARFVAESIQKHRKDESLPYGDMAILYRTNSQSRALEEGLMKHAIPYVMVGNVKFYDRKEIKDIIAYLRVLYNPNSSQDLLRILNVPKRGIGDTTVSKLTDYATRSGMTLFEVISNPDLETGVSPRARKHLDELAGLLFDLMGRTPTVCTYDLVKAVMEESGYVAELQKDEKGEDRLENLQELLTVARDFAIGDMEDNLENFLTRVALVSDVDDAELGDGRVTLMTLHAAKGLEFPVAFLTGLEEGIFPHARTLMNEAEVEEERRICYVGITRAQKKLYVSHAMSRNIYGRSTQFPPSRFLQEMPESGLDHQSGRARFAAAKAALPPRPVVPLHRGGSLGLTPHTQARDSEATHEVWRPGEKAKHGKWGVGTVVSVSGSGEDQTLKVAFEGQGIKTLAVKFAPISKA